MSTEADIVVELEQQARNRTVNLGASDAWKYSVEYRAIQEITKLRAERDAGLDHLVEALEVISEQYENGHVNHVEFRVHAKMTADAALQAYRAASVIATDGRDAT